jgi:hypothetical protein
MDAYGQQRDTSSSAAVASTIDTGVAMAANQLARINR